MDCIDCGHEGGSHAETAEAPCLVQGCACLMLHAHPGEDCPTEEDD